MTVLLVAAMPREFGGLLRLCGRGRKLDWPVDWAREAECGATRLLMAANGVGVERATTAAAAGRQARPDAVVSYGFCGGLDPSLRVGDIFAATAVAGPKDCYDTVSPNSRARYASGTMVTVGHVAGSAEEKARLRAGGAAAVDMEAAGVAREVAGWGVPFYCLRSVTDLADECLRVDFNSALRPDGHFDTMLLLRNAMRASALPDLWRLRGRCGIASRRLGEFFAGCRF